MDEDSTNSLGNLFPCPVILTVKKWFLMLRGNCLVFHSAPVAPCPVTEHQWKEPGSIIFAPSFQLFIHINEIHSEPPLLQANQPLSSLSLSWWKKYSSALIIFVALFWPFSTMSRPRAEKPRTGHTKLHHAVYESSHRQWKNVCNIFSRFYEQLL